MVFLVRIKYIEYIIYTNDQMFNFAMAVPIKKNIIISSKIFLTAIIIFILSFDEDNSTFPFGGILNIFLNS